MLLSSAMIKPAENPDSDSRKGAAKPVPQSFEAMVRDHLERLLKGIGKQGGDQLYKIVMQMVERLLLELVLSHCQGNQVEAARILGINRNTLARRSKELNIQGRGKRGRKKSKKTEGNIS